MAVLFERENAEKASEEVDGHLERDTAGTRKRGRGKIGKVVKHTAKHFSFQSRPKGRNRCERTGWAFQTRVKTGRKFKKAKAHAGKKELQTSPLNLCANSVHCNCSVCCKQINLTPVNLGRLIRACKDGANKSKTSGKFLCNLSDFTLGEETMRLLVKG